MAIWWQHRQPNSRPASGQLLDQARLHELATDAGLLVETYRRFLFGANQLVVLRPVDEHHLSKAA